MAQELQVIDSSKELQNSTQPTLEVKERENWLKRFDAQPERIAKYSGASYVPISVIEHSLTQDYMGLWSLDTPTYQVVANQIVGTAVLHVFDLNAKVWIRRVGFGAVVIRQSSGAQVTDASAIIKNALVMDFAKLKTEILKNAVKTLGKKYGGDLNRDIEDYYEAIYTNELDKEQLIELAQNTLPTITTIAEMDAFFQSNNFAGYPETAVLCNNHRLYLQVVAEYQLKKHKMSPEAITVTDRIIGNKEVSSYAKLLKSFEKITL